MVCGAMTKLADEANCQLIAAVTRDGKSYGIDSSLFRQAQTARGVAKITKLADFFAARLGTFMPGSAAGAVPASAERKPGGMNPSSILAFFSRHEEWTGHEFSQRCGHCTESVSESLVFTQVPAVKSSRWLC